MASDPKNLGAKFDAHTDAEFNTRDIEATMATMAEAPHVTHVPTMTGGSGYDAVRHFYENYFVGRVPDDWSVKSISRTIGESQLVDEVLISFTHDCDIPALLPGVKPTGRKVTIPFVVVVGFDKSGKVEFERIYWDQASVLVQLGLLNKRGLPITGAEQAARLLDPSLPSNTLIPKA
ncbi:MAG TPA: ester cyclase [Methyloceanibacter sp.]|nr:ester cyclase [Methyloceanibacter sp.]